MRNAQAALNRHAKPNLPNSGGIYVSLQVRQAGEACKLTPLSRQLPPVFVGIPEFVNALFHLYSSLETVLKLQGLPSSARRSSGEVERYGPANGKRTWRPMKMLENQFMADRSHSIIADCPAVFVIATPRQGGLDPAFGNIQTACYRKGAKFQSPKAEQSCYCHCMFWLGLAFMLLMGLLGNGLFCRVFCRWFPKFSDRRIQITAAILLFLSAIPTVCEHLQESSQKTKLNFQLQKLEEEVTANKAAAAAQDLIEKTIPDVRISAPPRICLGHTRDKLQPEWEVSVIADNSIPFTFFPSFLDGRGKNVPTAIYFELPKFFPQDKSKPIKIQFSGPFTEHMKTSSVESPWILNMEYRSIYQDKNPSLKLTRTMKALFYYSESDQQIHLIKPSSSD